MGISGFGLVGADKSEVSSNVNSSHSVSVSLRSVLMSLGCVLNNFYVTWDAFPKSDVKKGKLTSRQ